MKTKKITPAEGSAVRIERFSNFHYTGSISGMKRLYYGPDALLVRCGSYIYHVDQETYDKAH